MQQGAYLVAADAHVMEDMLEMHKRRGYRAGPSERRWVENAAENIKPMSPILSTFIPPD